MTGLNNIEQIVDHIRTTHLIVSGDETATNRNIDILIREVAICWQQYEA
jgi:hypothetical protein